MLKIMRDVSQEGFKVGRFPLVWLLIGFLYHDPMANELFASPIYLSHQIIRFALVMSWDYIFKAVQFQLAWKTKITFRIAHLPFASLCSWTADCRVLRHQYQQQYPEYSSSSSREYSEFIPSHYPVKLPHATTYADILSPRLSQPHFFGYSDLGTNPNLKSSLFPEPKSKMA